MRFDCLIQINIHYGYQQQNHGVGGGGGTLRTLSHNICNIVLESTPLATPDDDDDDDEIHHK